MRLKTYFASSVEAAMLLALEQMGPEAMIVNSRKTSPENRHLGEYEVVFALASETKPAEDVAEAAGGESQSQCADNEAARRLHAEVAHLASQIESLGRAMKRADAKHSVSNFKGEQVDVAHSLSEAGFSEEFVLELFSEVPRGAGSLRFRILQVLTDRLKSGPSLGRMGQGRKVVALVGPSGVGKSAMIAKLATRFGVSARRPCQILSLDSDRIAASEPLRIIAGVLGVGFRVVEDPPFLAHALEAVRDRDLILIDTPGFARDEGEALERLGHVLAVREEIDVHLVLPATMKQRDMERAVKFYQPLNPRKLMLTRLDETEQIGTALETSVLSGIPVSYLSGGPRIPEDLEAAQSAELARRVFLPLAGGFTRRAAA